MDRGVARIAIIVVLAAVGGLVLANGFDDDAVSASSPTPSVTPSDTPSPTDSSTPTDAPAVEPQPPEEVTFMALNATTVTGMAAEAESVLEQAGYVSAGVDDAPTTGAQETSVLYRGGDDKAQNKANARFISKEYFPGSSVGLLSPDYDDVVSPDATVVVITGQDFADAVLG